MKFSSFLATLLVFISLNGIAQNVHFTYVDFAPQSYNPALNGAFSGTYRGSAIVRNQYPDVQGYQTVELNIDAPIIRGFRVQDWIGVGISFDTDKSARVLSQTASRMGLAYHFALDKKQTNIFTLGIQYINIGARLDKPGYASLKENGLSDPAIEMVFQASPSGGNPIASLTSSNWVLGTTFTRNNKTGKFIIGGAVSGIIRGTSAIKSTQYKQPFMIQGIAQYKSFINKQVLIEPTLFMQLLPSESNEIMFNTTVGYKLKKDSDWIVKAGLGVRTGTTSLQFLAGAEKGPIKVGLSYDAPMGGFGKAPGVQNAFELGVSYIGTLKKTPKPKPTIICPRL